jgi:FkbM family methyltransferase
VLGGLIAAFVVVILVEIFSPLTAVLLGLRLVQGGPCSFAETYNSRRIAEAPAIQKACRLLARDGELQLWDTPLGRYWLPGPLDRRDAHCLAELKLRMKRDGERGIHRGDVVLDCGAAFGSITRFALDRGAGLVVAIEPAPQAVACLRRTFAREIEQGRVIVVAKGVWDREDRLMLHDDSLVMDREGPAELVPLTTIDHLAAQIHLPRVDFINMDIEGAENKALAGARDVLTRFRPRLCIASEHYPDDMVTIPRTVLGTVPQYEVYCARCTAWEDFRIRPELLFFGVRR